TRSAKISGRRNVLQAPEPRAGWTATAASTVTSTAGASTNRGARAAPGRAGWVRLTMSLHAAQQVLQPQLPHHPGRFPDDAPVHLGRAGAPVHEQDRYLPQAKAALPALERHFDLKRVAVGLHPVEADALERPPPEALVTPGRVVDGQSGHPTSVAVREVGK